ncbi:hypothetical protein ACF1FX_32595 [Streptomyces sp. NPDC014646]|uniref:hypothetical protein n=1 Tax=Streptomyces sp. NPDC014646 TaxID=3364877 RepID=UPI0036FA72BE
MTRDSPTAAPVLTTWAEYYTDWRVYIDDSIRGPLGYCTGPDAPFDPAAATPEQGGWLVTGP